MVLVRDKKEKIIYNSETERFGLKDAIKVGEIANNCSRNSVIVNMENVLSIKNESLDTLKEISKENELSMCSLDADIFAVMNLLHYDKFFKIYPNEHSSTEEINELKNRRFKIV